MDEATGFVPFDELSAYEKIGKVLTNHHFHVSKLFQNSELKSFRLKIPQFDYKGDSIIKRKLSGGDLSRV